MKPATPTVEPTPTTQFRKKVFGGSLKPLNLKLLVALSFALLSAWDARAAITASNMETLVTTQQRQARGLNYWPDGGMGIVQSGNSFIFMAANGGNSARTVGTLTNPIATQVTSSIVIQNQKTNYNYIAGGYIYQSTNSTAWLMIYHTERWLNGVSSNFWSSLGMARSINQGQTWSDLGEIIRLGLPFGSTGSYDIGGGSFALNNGYMYVYFHDNASNGTAVALAVARAQLSDIETAANLGAVTPFYKYYNGSWSQSGLGGASSKLGGSVNPAPSGWWGSVAYNSFLQTYILIYVSSYNLYLTTSTDGLNWSGSTVIANTSAEEFYPTVLGFDGNARTTGEQFYVYYTYSVTGGWNRWVDAVLARRMVSMSGAWPQAPAISGQPTNQTVKPGQSAAFSVSASGTAPMNYQWRFDGTNIASATNASLSLTNVHFTNDGSYTVTVSNLIGVTTSSNAVLAVGWPPVIRVQPASQSVESNCNATLNVSACGLQPLSYQWWKDDLALAAETNSSLAIASVQASNFGSYTVVVSNALGATNSTTAVLALASAPVANPDVVLRFAEGGVRMNAADLTANDVVAMYDGLTVIAVSSNSAAGGTVNLNGPWIYYAPPVGGTSMDSFTYTVSDGHCGTDMGTATVQIKADNPLPLHFAVGRMSDGSLQLIFDGIPGDTYHLEYSASLSPPNWQVLTNQTADSFGVVQFADWPMTSAAGRFYRAVCP